MGYTIEDMLVSGKDRYKIELKAGRNGWSNSISWLFMVEDMTILQHFSGKELAVTTGLGFQTEEALMTLVKSLHERSEDFLVDGLVIILVETLDQILR